MPTRAPTRAQTLTLALASLGFVSLGLPEGALGVAWPSIRATFDLPLDALGLLLGTFASGYFVSSAVSGKVLARVGVGGALAGSCVMTGVCLLGYAVASSWLSMVALGGLLGIGAGTIDAGLNTFAAVAHGPRVLNWMHAAFGLGAAVGPLLMTAVISSGLPWTIGYALVGLAQVGLGLAYAAARERFDSQAARASHTEQLEAGSARALVRQPLAWFSMALFFVYVGLEVAASQWSFSLFTLARGAPTTVAGILVSAYWASLTLGRVLFGVIVTRVSTTTLLRVCMLAATVAGGLIWLDVPVLSWLALALLGLALAPIFPVLIADTPGRLGMAQAANAVGLQVAAAMLGGAALPATVGVLAARLGLEVVGPCLVGLAVGQLLLHEALVRRASEQQRSARSRSSAGASFPPGA